MTFLVMAAALAIATDRPKAPGPAAAIGLDALVDTALAGTEPPPRKSGGWRGRLTEISTRSTNPGTATPAAPDDAGPRPDGALQMNALVDRALADFDAAPSPPPAKPTVVAQNALLTKVNTRRVRLDVTFLVNDSPAGEIGIETSAQGDAAVDIDQLRALLKPIAAPQVLKDLTALAAGRPLVSVAELNSSTFPLIFDTAALQLKLTLQGQSRSITSLSIANLDGQGTSTLTPAAERSFGMTMSVADRFNHQGVQTASREPVNAVTQGFVNAGGVDGLNLTFQAGYRENGGAFRRRTTLFHDNIASAIRYSAGDIDPQTVGNYQAPTSLVGFSVERMYETIQPYRNLRPAGRGGLVLDRPSTVNVMVNGSLYRTLTLAPGRYDLRDFPFLDGLNDVQLIVQDDAGRREALGLSFFSDTRLLDPGISIFSAALGVRQDAYGQFETTRYGSSALFNGFYQRGLSDRLTLGGVVQADRNNGLVGAQVAVGTQIGVFGFETATDMSTTDAVQAAAVLTYRLSHVGEGGRQQSIDVDLQTQTTHFSPMVAASPTVNPFQYDLTTRLQTSLTRDTYATFAAGYSRGRGLQADRTNLGAGVNRSFGRVSTGLNYDYRDGDLRDRHRVTLSLSVPIGTSQSVQTSYESSNNRASVDYNLQALEGLDQTGARVALAREDGGQSANLQADHYSNRFRASVRHDYAKTTLGGTQETTDVNAAVGIGYANGAWALGRRADQGFAIVGAHRNLKGSPVVVSDRYSLGPAARTGALGPALVPVQRGYQRDSVEVKVEKLPVGYDIGAGQFDILPGAASGFRFVIGSAASNTVIGRIEDAAGQPVGYLAGVLKPISGKEAKQVEFFTNRTGRLVAQKVAPGRYAVIPVGAQSAIAEVVVPDSARGAVDVGRLVSKDDKR